MEKKLYFLLPFRCVVFLLVFVLGTMMVDKQVEEISNWWSVVASVVNVITILLLVFVARKQGSNY